MPSESNVLLSVEAARQRIETTFQPVGAETISLDAALGRVLDSDAIARRTQPPVDLSSMDGWAVRAVDVAKVPATLKPVGQAPAGGAFAGTVGPGQAVRIFTGGPVPAGADAIVIQEDADLDGDRLTIRESSKVGRHIRVAGLDFRAGAVGVRAGHRLTPRDIALLAAMDLPWLSVRRKPRIAILATGDELVLPGEPIGPNQIVSSNNAGLAALIRQAGAEPIDLGIAPDRPDALAAQAAGAGGCDLLVTLGGASVGDHDLIHSVLGAGGAAIDFWRIAMRPGKPLMFGRIPAALGGVPLLGLPGNPVSALVCALVFLRPALDAMLGVAGTEAPETALLGKDLAANDRRQDYIRATLSHDAEGNALATAFAVQDSSMLSILAASDCLIVRPPHAPTAKAGDRVAILRLDRGF